MITTKTSPALPVFSTPGFKNLLLVALLLFFLPTSILAEEDEKSAKEKQEFEQKRRNVAVALNYCRASFHRIRKYPNEQVIKEEEEKILNNLNLNGIQDPEIIRLYSDVLDEIGQMRLTEKEAELYETKYKRTVRQELAFDTLSVGLDLLTAQYLGAVRTGARSWWDYRSFQWNRDNEVFKLEKARVNSVVKKSTNFLDTFWKLTQQFDIPDRWLVRSTDLDNLEEAMNEDDLKVRLRILKRMEPFMQCYPPYWYYVARTQQSLGELTESLSSYNQLSGLGTDHFRRDDMLASAFANQAVIQSHLNEGNPVETARKALAFSTEVWEANLACARILQQAGQLASAEDAILRNLDVDLEKEQSTVSLLSFYYDTNNTRKLAQYLGKEETIARVPPPVLIRFASRLPREETPPLVWTALASSMRVIPQVKFGNDDILLACHPVWRIERGKLVLQKEDGTAIEGEYHKQGNVDLIRFADAGDFGNLLSGPSSLPPLNVQIQYGEANPIQLSFSEESLPGESVVTGAITKTKTAKSPEQRGYHLIAARWGDQDVAYIPKFPHTAQLYEPMSYQDAAASFGSKAAGEIKSANQDPEESDEETKIK